MDAVGWEQRLGEELLDNGREVRASRGSWRQGRLGVARKCWREATWKSFQGDWVSHRLQDAQKDQDAK